MKRKLRKGKTLYQSDLAQANEGGKAKYLYVWHMQWLSQLLGGLLVGDYMTAMDKNISFWMQRMHMYVLVTVSKDKISGLLQKLCENFNDTYFFVPDNLWKILLIADIVHGLEVIMFLQYISLLLSHFQEYTVK